MKIIVYLSLLILVSPVFFYKLGQSSLSSWDEAWYGAVAKNITFKSNPFLLSFNGQHFVDHTPVGFWLMAVSVKIFGASEFGVRAASAIAGIITLVLVFGLGKELFSEYVGAASALALTTSPWFILRSRTGNLDIFLTLFFVLTIWLAIKSSQDRKYLIRFSLSLTLFFLTKTMVPLTIIPALIYILWSKIRSRDLVKPFLIFGSLIGTWLISQIMSDTNFIGKYFIVGIPRSENGAWLFRLSLLKTYLHNGIGNWFRSGIVSLGIGTLLLKKPFLILFIIIFSFLLPFSFSSRGQIWHLIPIHPFLILAVFGIVHTFLPRAKLAVIITILLLLAIPQLYKNWHEFIDIPTYISDEAILSTEAGKHSQELIVDRDFVPTAVFYSNKTVTRTRTDLIEYFKTKESFQMITTQWRLDRENILPAEYKVMKTDRDMLLILKDVPGRLR